MGPASLLAATAMQRCVKRWDPFEGPTLTQIDLGGHRPCGSEVLSRAALLVSWPLVGSLLHNITSCKSKKLSAQKRKLCVHSHANTASAGALYNHRFTLRRPKYIQMSNREEVVGMDNRWTIRRVSVKARKQVEELHMMTGIPYGRLVSEAIGVWYNQFHTRKPARGPDDHFFWRTQPSEA